MKKYIEVYELYKEKIVSAQLVEGDKLPSVRSASELYRVSRTTIQNAYFLLSCEGYIISKSQSGYYVSSINFSKKRNINTNDKKEEIIYDLTGNSADQKSFDFNLWQRYLKNAIRQKERLISYSDNQGESDLRNVLCDYIREKRNIITSPDNIVIGAGFQSLLHILCSILKDKKSISFPDGSFTFGMSVFEDCDYKIFTRYKDADIIYVSPSHMTKSGDVMPIKRRLELVKYSKDAGSIVIEDDFENEFIYNKTPTPSLFALGSGNIVYMGSFSAMLLPGIRISFMVLDSELIDKYKKNKYKFSQTASKTEQIALCSYLSDGNMNARTKKLRRLYTQRTKIFYSLLTNTIENGSVKIGQNGLIIVLKIKDKISENDFKKVGIDLIVEESKSGAYSIIISPCAIDESEMQNVINKIKDVISSEK